MTPCHRGQFKNRQNEHIKNTKHFNKLIGRGLDFLRVPTSSLKLFPETFPGHFQILERQIITSSMYAFPCPPHSLEVTLQGLVATKKGWKGSNIFCLHGLTSNLTPVYNYVLQSRLFIVLILEDNLKHSISVFCDPHFGDNCSIVTGAALIAITVQFFEPNAGVLRLIAHYANFLFCTCKWGFLC